MKTGLWINKSKNGTTYMSGTLKLDKDYSIRIFKNTKKTEEKQPDYTLLFDEKITKEATHEVKLTDEDIEKTFTTDEKLTDDMLPF